MSKQVELVAATYDDAERANLILDMLQRMHTGGTITLVDAALVTRGQDGKVHVNETREVTTKKGAWRGALVTGVLGVIYPPSLLASVLAGGVAGGLFGKLRDTGIKTAQIKEITEALAPSQSAVIALVDSASAATVASNLEDGAGRLIREHLGADADAVIEDASASGDPASGPAAPDA